MKRTNPKKTGEAGYALAVVMILVFSMGIVGSAFYSMAGHETIAAQKNLDSQRAFWLAEGAKARALRHLVELSSPPQTGITIFEDMPGPNGGSYSVYCNVDTTDAWEVEKSFVLDCVGNSGDIERRIRQRIKMTSFALFAMFTDQETNGHYTIWHVSGSVIEGRLHTNGKFSIYGDPQFLGQVTSASDHMTGYRRYWVNEPSDWPCGGNNPYFAEGFELEVEPIPMPTETDDLKQLAMTGGVYIGGEADLQLGVIGETTPITAPGWLRYRDHSPPGAEWTSVQISSLANKVFYCNDDLHVEGLLDGELTISSNRDILIEDDLLYAGANASGQPLPGCDDMLGLVAEKNIIFVDNAANRDDLIIDSVLMALDTSIEAEDYDEGSPRGTLTIWGGLIQKYRGPVGTAGWGGMVATGYDKNYRYDARVTARTPPYFPQTGQYEELDWEETWDESDPF